MIKIKTVDCKNQKFNSWHLKQLLIRINKNLSRSHSIKVIDKTEPSPPLTRVVFPVVTTWCFEGFIIVAST